MAARVKVRAAIWVDDKLVVYRSERRGQEHLTLPGGRVNSHESVTDALIREVDEEIGIAIEVGELIFVAEILNSSSVQDVELVFEARALEAPAEDWLELVDPRGSRATKVLPPILGELAERHARGSLPEGGSLWLGNIYRVGVPQP